MNEPTKAINKIDDKNDSTTLDSYIPKKKILNKPKLKIMKKILKIKT